MKRRLLLLNLVLLALVVGAAWRLHEQWAEKEEHLEKVLRQRLGKLPAPALSLAQPPQPLAASSYGDVAQKVLFTRDRNPDVVVEAVAPKPLPALPVAHGVLNFGDGPSVILSEKSGGPHRSYGPGEKIGAFKVVAVTNEEIELEFEGRYVTKRLEELADRGEPQQPSQRTAAPAAQPARSAATTQVAVEPKVAAGPGAAINEGLRACAPNDSTPAGAVVDGWRKVVSKTPFGSICRWEPVP